MNSIWIIHLYEFIYFRISPFPMPMPACSIIICSGTIYYTIYSYTVLIVMYFNTSCEKFRLAANGCIYSSMCINWEKIAFFTIIWPFWPMRSEKEKVFKMFEMIIFVDILTPCISHFVNSSRGRANAEIDAWYVNWQQAGRQRTIDMINLWNTCTRFAAHL